jgi:hypothetical protein
MKDEMIHIATHQRALSLLNYYRNKAKLCVCCRANGRPRKKQNATDVSITELKRERKRVEELRKTIQSLESDRALLSNEVIRWRAAFIRSHETLNLIPDSKLREAIEQTNGRHPKTSSTNPIIRSRRPNDSDTISAECESLLPKIPKSRLDIKERSRLSEISRRDLGTDDSP